MIGEALGGHARKRVIVVALVSGCWSSPLWVHKCSVRAAFARPLFNVLAESDGKPIISIDGAEVFPVTGQLEMTTVSEQGWSLWRSDPVRGLHRMDRPVGRRGPRRCCTPDTSGDAARQAGSDQFSDSQEQARIAALQEVGGRSKPSPDPGGVA